MGIIVSSFIHPRVGLSGISYTRKAMPFDFLHFTAWEGKGKVVAMLN
jgi:hypothetical protein